MVSKIEVNTAEYKIPQIYLSTKYAKMLKSKNPRGFVIPTYKVQVTNLPDFDLSNFYLVRQILQPLLLQPLLLQKSTIQNKSCKNKKILVIGGRASCCTSSNVSTG